MSHHSMIYKRAFSVTQLTLWFVGVPTKKALHERASKNNPFSERINISNFFATNF